MSATGFLSAHVQFSDANGSPLAGGKLTFYEAGTANLQDTFLNADLAPGHENTNPVILDSAGCAVIYFSPTPAYDLVATDANDVPQGHISQVSISPAQVAT